MNNNNTDTNVSAEEEHDNLGELVIDCVKRAGLQKIRPAQLSKELGISIDEASEELCGLLAAVGGGQNGASFVFEPVATATATAKNDTVSTTGQQQQQQQQHYTMVFTFPADFERRCKTYRIKQELRETFWYVCENLFKFIRAVLSFGLILSLSIVALVALIAIFSAMIAIASRQGNNNNRRGGINNFGNMRRFISSLRRLLWIYVFLTPAGNNNDSDLMWNVRDFLMMTSFWYNPLWFMFSLRSRMNRRRYRMRRGWGWSSGRANNSSSSSPADEFLSTNIDGVYTNNNRRSWQGNNNQHARRSNNNAANQSNQEPLFLLINNIMEFLFGPENQSRTNPSIQSRWKSRARFIIDQGGKVSLEDFMPFVDYPSSSSSSEALLIVSYFNGVPCSSSTSNDDVNTLIFEFPELMIETEMLPESKYSQYLIQSSEDESEASKRNNLNLDKFWSNFLYETEEGEESMSSISSAINSTTDGGNSTASLQQNNNNKHYLVEYPCVMTRLKKDNFMKCVGLGIVNYVGVSMIYKGLVSGAIELPVSTPLFLVAFVCGFIKVLSWYSALFFILFLVRMIFLVPFNVLILKRNKLRMNLALAR